jgi:methylenetetrahydrofolate reductase (NADPH)
MRALRGQIGRFGRLLADTGPDDVVRGLRAAPGAATAPIAGFHLFPFGGLRKAGDWLGDYRNEAGQGALRETARGMPETSAHKP